VAGRTKELVPVMGRNYSEESGSGLLFIHLTLAFVVWEMARRFLARSRVWVLEKSWERRSQ
jgi:hypothetical protein